MKAVPILLACVVAGVLLLYPGGAGVALGQAVDATPTALPVPSLAASGEITASTPIPPPLIITATPVPSPAIPALTATPPPLPSNDIHIQANPLDVVINEVAWGGTAADSEDEWIELKSNLPITADLSGWRLRSSDGTPDFLLGGVIAPGGYYLLERDDDSTVLDLPADQIYLGSLTDAGETLTLLDPLGVVVDTVNLDGGPWPGGSGFPSCNSMERIAPAAPGSDANWGSNDGLTRNGLDALGSPLDGTPRQPNSLAAPPPPPGSLYIGEVLYDATTPSSSGDEFAEICNAHSAAVDLTNHKIGDAQAAGNGEGMYLLPPGTTLAAGACLVVAKNAAQFAARFGAAPDFELVTSGSSYVDTPGVPDLAKYTDWSGGSWALADDGDEVLLLNSADAVADAAAYGTGDFAALGLGGRASAPQPESLQRVWPFDSDDMSADFLRASPSPGSPTYPPPPPGSPPPAIPLPGGMYAFFGDLHSYTTYSDGAGPPRYAFAVGRANRLHFLALTDHTAWLDGAHWADIAAQASSATVDGAFVGLRGFEWAGPGAGYMGIFGTATYASPGDPAYDTPVELYAWLSAQAGAVGDFHRPAADGDFDDFAYAPDAGDAVALLETGSGVAPYSRFESAFLRALARGWRVAPVNNSATTTVNWGADTPHRTGIVAPALTQADLLDALRARRVFATEDSNLALALRGNGGAWMGEVIADTAWLTFTVSFHDDDAEPLTMTLYDRALPIAQTSTGDISGTWQASTPGMAGHYYFAKAVQGDGDLAYSAPLWIEGTPTPDAVYVNEFLANPHAVDWDHNGTADANDEWIELYNPSPRPVGLGGYLLDDAEGGSDPYEIPLGTVITGGGFLLFYRNTTGLALNASRESVRLFRPDGTSADSVTFDSSPGYDRSWCRSSDGTGPWSKECIETPGEPNKLRPPPPANEPPKVSIARARCLPSDKTIVIVGWVTAPPPLFGQDIFYIQDETAGIRVRVNNEPFPTLAEGDKVRITGHTWDYHGERELRAYSGKDVQFREPGRPPDPLPIETAGVAEANEGLLTVMTGRAVALARSSFFLDDGSGAARVLLLGGTDIARPALKGEEVVTVVGIVSQESENWPYLGGYRFLPRYPRDLRLPPSPPKLLAWPSLLPETGR
jgi:hypothetical protein